jgi:hypothetical protein
MPIVKEIIKKKVAVIGTGSAGIQSLSFFLAWLDALEFEVVSIHDPSIPIVGIGESTNPTFIDALEYGTRFNLYDNLEELDATLKLTTRFENWREHDFHNPLINGSAAIHFNTFKLREFAIPRLKKVWRGKFKEVVGTVDSMTEHDDKVTMVIDGEEHNYDFVVDCRGFPKSYEDYSLMPVQTVNHCLVHNVQEDDKEGWKYTLHRATPDGWMFGVPLTNRKSYGYLFNDTITTKEEALQNFSKEIGVPVEELQNIEYKFNSYRAKQIIGRRIFKNGNRAVFFEPLFANSLHLYDKINRAIVGCIAYGGSSADANAVISAEINNVATVIAYMYRGGSIHDTPFWNGIKEPAQKILEESDAFHEFIHAMRFSDSRNYYRSLSFVFNEKNFKIMDSDTHFGYGFFDKITLQQLQELRLQVANDGS